MSIASEITRINTEVASQTDLMSQIQAAMAGKVVNGGTNINLDAELATQDDLIADIQAALETKCAPSPRPVPSGPKMATGTLSISSASLTASITGLDFTPTGYAICRRTNSHMSDSYSTSDYNILTLCRIDGNDSLTYYDVSNNNVPFPTNTNWIAKCVASSGSLSFDFNGFGYKFYRTYYYVVWGE